MRKRLLEAARRRRKNRKQGGVTLVEIMIVLAIIALIMGFLVGPKVIAMFKDAKTQTAWMVSNEYVGAYAKWMADNEEEGDCPAKLEDLTKYMNKKDTKDPWGSTFIMVCGEEAGDGGFGVKSPGADKKDGTEDDIKSWQKKPKK
jgi:general secretion pathway protein G